MADPVLWPANLVPVQITIAPPAKWLSAAGSISGLEQITPARRAPFRMDLSFSTLIGNQVLAWRAIMAELGDAGTVKIPMFDLYDAAATVAGFAPVTFDGGVTFSDGSSFAGADVEGIAVTCAAGTRSITVDFGDYGQCIQAGQYFGIGQDPHIARRVTWDDAGQVATIAFSSSAKRAHAGAAFTLRPTMIARLAAEDGGAIALDYGAYGAPSLSLVEAILV